MKVSNLNKQIQEPDIPAPDTIFSTAAPGDP